MDKYDCLKLENQLCFPLYAASRKVTSQYTPFLKQLNITYTQYIVFMVLWDNDSMTVGELCEKLYLDSGTLTPLLKKMQDHGYIVRTRLKEDERVVMVQLTEAGKKLRDECVKIPEKMKACMNITEEESKFLYQILYKLIQNMETNKYE